MMSQRPGTDRPVQQTHSSGIVVNHSVKYTLKPMFSNVVLCSVGASWYLCTLCGRNTTRTVSKDKVLLLVAFFTLVVWSVLLWNSIFSMDWISYVTQVAQYQPHITLHYSVDVKTHTHTHLTLFHMFYDSQGLPSSPASHRHMVLSGSAGGQGVHRRWMAQNFIFWN